MSMFWALAERRIQEAIEAGDLDVPAGAEIRGLDQPYDPMWWVKAWIEREGIDVAVLRHQPGAGSPSADEDFRSRSDDGHLGEAVRGQRGRGV